MAEDLIAAKTSEDNLLERLAALEKRVKQLEKNQKQPFSPPTYTASNVTTDRSYNADTVVVAELADVVGTMIADLRTQGRFA